MTPYTPKPASSRAMTAKPAINDVVNRRDDTEAATASSIVCTVATGVDGSISRTIERTLAAIAPGSPRVRARIQRIFGTYHALRPACACGKYIVGGTSCRNP